MRFRIIYSCVINATARDDKANFLDRSNETVLLLHKSLVRPHLEYCLSRIGGLQMIRRHSGGDRKKGSLAILTCA